MYVSRKVGWRVTGITHTRTCPPPMNDGGAVREVFDRISDKWSLLVVGALREGPLRFGELEKVITGISQRMLTLTLKHLVQDGLVSRTA
ncbi:MAG: hypothetical protein QOF58_899, partial [Pseudonocardiales bacterium]|nr:hypothetical protein [Pseudonocardiales bacterium]